MKILDSIKKAFSHGDGGYFFHRAEVCLGGELLDRPFARVVWYNICDILCDLCEDVALNYESGDIYKFAAFKAFFYKSGKIILQRLFDFGFVVVGWDGVRFWQMSASDYLLPSSGDIREVRAVADGVTCYVLQSASYECMQMSDRALCRPFLDLLDDVLNSTATATRKLGALIIASPKNLNNANMAINLDKRQKQELEKELQEDYGALKRQSNIMLLPREMNWQIINLAGLDLRMQEKVRTAILAIVDRIKIPANQIAIIDANSNKQLANGSELREGDRAKYKSFRRLFEHVFVQLATDCGLRINYTITGEPLTD